MERHTRQELDYLDRQELVDLVIRLETKIERLEAESAEGMRPAGDESQKTLDKSDEIGYTGSSSTS